MHRLSQARLSVMGGVMLYVGDSPLPVPGAKKHRLLSRLALTPSDPVTVDALVDALWGDEPPRTAKQSLHVHISHLRDRLRPHGVEKLIQTTSDGRYVLGLELDQLDVARFENLVVAGLASARANNYRYARDVLTDAMGLWGDPFVALDNLAGAIAERQRLAALHERSVDALSACLIELGELDTVVPLLRAEVAKEPIRERPYEQLMRLYLAQGETALVVEVYAQLADSFARSLGIAPSDAVSKLRDQALDGSRPLPQPSRPAAELDVAASTLITVTAGSDSRELVNEVVALAGAQRRRVAHGRLSVDSEVSPLSPVVELAGLDPQRAGSTVRQHRLDLYDEITNALIRKHLACPVLLLEGLERATPQLLDYLRSAVTKPGPVPFTLIATYVPEYADNQTIAALGATFENQMTVELPVAVPIDDPNSLSADERRILTLLTCATLPIPAEVVVRASGLDVGAAAAAIERLLARSILSPEAGGGLGWDQRDQLRGMLEVTDKETALAHIELVEAIGRSSTASSSYRRIAEARHRLSALPAGDHEAAWMAALDAAKSLSEFDASRDVVELIGRAGTALQDAEPSIVTLGVMVELGRAEIRAGMSLVGLATLERALVVARALDDAELFAEAVRAIVEERAPQRSQDETRDLISEALTALVETPSDTRVQLMTDLANSWYLVDQPRAEALAVDAVERAKGVAPETRARALTGLLQAGLRPDNANERLQWCVEAQRHARRSDSTETLVLALTYEACALMELGQPRRADPPLRYAEALAADVQVPRFQWWAAAWRALVDFALGDLERAEERFHFAYGLWPTSTRADPFECFAAQVAALRFVQGRGAELLPALASLDVANNVGFLAPLALAQAQADHPDTADTLENLIACLAECVDTRLPYGLALAAEAAWQVEFSDAGARLVTMVEPLAHVYTTLNVWGGGGFYWGALRHAYGLSLALAGDRSAAHQQLQRAAADQAAAGIPVFAARSETALALL